MNDPSTQQTHTAQHNQPHQATQAHKSPQNPGASLGVSQFSQILQKSKRDFLSAPMIALNMLPVLLGLVFWGVVLYAFSDTLYAYATGLLPESWRGYLYDSGIGAWTLGFALKLSLYLLLGACVLLLAVVGNVFASMFYVPIAISHIRKHHYPHLPKPTSPSLRASLVYFLKAFVLLCASCVICSPLFFIPIIGGVLLLVPFFVFFYKVMMFDIGHEVLGDEYKHILQSTRKQAGSRLGFVFLTYLLGFIPVANFFTPLLQVLMLGHYCFALAESSRGDPMQT